MKVYIGPYLKHWSSDRVENLYYRLRHHKYEFQVDKKDKLDLIVEDLLSFYNRSVCRFLNIVTRKFFDRKEKIKIHSYDVWNADQTLALIIHPTLLKLKEIKHGSPNVDNEDVPEHLRYIRTKEEEWSGTTDDLWPDRWDYVLDEMIWAFNELKDGCEGEYAFNHNSDNLELIYTPNEDKTLYSIDFNYQKDPSKPKYWVDEEGKKAYHDRVSNGLRLFGKYYRALWD